jgi:hypothetical protein
VLQLLRQPSLCVAARSRRRGCDHAAQRASWRACATRQHTQQHLSPAEGPRESRRTPAAAASPRRRRAAPLRALQTSRQRVCGAKQLDVV